MLTKNFKELQAEVADHVAADRVAQRSYETCFIGCLANGNDDPEFIENAYGIPLMVTRIGESIFEGLRSNEAVDFFAAIPQAIGSDGKDLTLVGWKFLATELRALPPVADDIQACIDTVIEGMDLLGEGKEWPRAAARSAIRATCAAAYATCAAAYAARTHTSAESDAIWSATRAATGAAYAATDATSFAAVAAARSAIWSAAAYAATDATRSAIWSAAAIRRQRDTLLQLISEAPITQKEDN